MSSSVLNRFSGLYIAEPNSGCWLWLGPVNKGGYGKLQGMGEQYAHRVSFTLAHGSILPEHEIDHVCVNTFCVNPDHLEMVTKSEHVARGVMRRARTGVCRVGHPRPSGIKQCSICQTLAKTRKVQCECGEFVSKNSLPRHIRRRHTQQVDN